MRPECPQKTAPLILAKTGWPYGVKPPAIRCKKGYFAISVRELSQSDQSRANQPMIELPSSAKSTCESVQLCTGLFPAPTDLPSYKSSFSLASSHDLVILASECSLGPARPLHPALRSCLHSFHAVSSCICVLCPARGPWVYNTPSHPR